MFTGLVESCGRIKSMNRSGNGAVVTVSTTIPLAEMALGESIAVNGACLTVTELDSGSFCADVSPESLDKTTLGDLQAGDMVNLERALRLGDRFGGHIVTGHIDGVGEIVDVRRKANAVLLTVSAPSELARYLVAKGSICIDGISLTVNSVQESVFSVSIIPHTLEATTLNECRPGRKVNLETDILGKYVERMLGFIPGQGESNVTREFLAKHGFM